MNMQPDRNEINDDALDLCELWDKFKPIFMQYKYWMLVTPVVFVFLGLGLSKIPDRKWEAVATIQVGRVLPSESSEHVGRVLPSESSEPLNNIVVRLKTSKLRNSVLNQCGIALDSPEASLYQNSLNAMPNEVEGLIIIKLRAFSRESALKLLSATGSELVNSHVSVISRWLSGAKRRLAAVEKLHQDLAALKTSKQLSSENKSLAEIAAAYLTYETGQLKFSLRDQIHFAELYPTVVVDEGVGSDPVSPRTSLWIGYSLILGLFLGIAVPWALYSVKR